METCDFLFTLEFINEEGSLERLLGKMRSRGFKLVAVSANETVDGKKVRARMLVRSSRSIDSLLKHLLKSPLVIRANREIANQNDSYPAERFIERGEQGEQIVALAS